MKVACVVVLLISTYLSENCAHANFRVRRQLGGYRFPGPRLSDDYASASQSRALVKREPQYEDEYSRPSPASGYRSPQPTSPYNQPEVSEYPSRPYAPSSPYQRERDNKRSNYGSSASASSRKKEEDEPEEDKKPSQLELLLAQSKFVCSDKKDGYYADTGLGCQVFHYCVQGVKHSWMCPDQTVFHQVHLNCVPSAQDICKQSEKYFVVNDYLHREIDQRGPNNTVRYHQRYYPEEFLGDAALNLPQSFGYPPEQSPAPATAARQSSAYSQPKPRPTYSDEVDQDTAIPYNNYRPQSYPSSGSRDQSPSSSSYRAPSSGSASRPYAAAPALPQRKPTAESPSYAPSYASYPSSYPSTPAPYRPAVSSGLRYAQSSGTPVRSYPSSSARAASSPYTPYASPPSSSAAASYSGQSRSTPAPYQSSPNSVYKKANSAPASRYPYVASYPSLSSASSPASSASDAYPPISPSYDSGYRRYNSAFSGSDYPSRYRTGVTYESDF